MEEEKVYNYIKAPKVTIKGAGENGEKKHVVTGINAIEDIDAFKEEILDTVDAKVGAIDLGPYETKQHAEATYQPKGDYLTEHQDLSDYAKTTEVTSAIEAAITDLAINDYARTADVETELAKKVDKTALYTEVDGEEQLNVYTKAQVDSAISTAKSELINGAPATYDTLKEIADYIEAHKSVETSLNAAIGNKANKSDVYTKTEVDSKVSTVSSELTTLAAKVGTLADGKVLASELTVLASKVATLENNLGGYMFVEE